MSLAGTGLPHTLAHDPGVDRPPSPTDPDAQLFRLYPAADELEDANLSILDLENIVPTGQIVERQRDRGTRETKYVVQGCTLDGTGAEVVAKVGHTGRLFIITVNVL
jgi:hypothetical protein